MSGAFYLLAALQVAGAAGSDSIPRISLPEALRRATPLDPGYVEASGRVHDAVWQRRSAFSALVLPSVTATSSATEFSSEFFNFGTAELATRIVDARLEARYDVFRGGGKLFELSRARAAVDAAVAAEQDARFAAELATESAYYDVLAQRELLGVAEERVRRAQEQFAVARARVLSGAVVHSDSLQLLLELTQARVAALQQQAALRVARLLLGRRVGIPGPVDAVPLEALPAPELPIAEQGAVAQALDRGPRYRAARANERAADAAVKVARGSYLPEVSLVGQWMGFDDTFFPNATTRTSFGITVSFPLWDNGQREVSLARARAERDAAQAIRADVERGAHQEVIDAYQGYTTARASADLAEVAVRVAVENLRVQNQRYRAGATTIIDLIIAQVAASEAEADLVQARLATRLALARLESLLGQRLFPIPGAQQ